MVNSTCPFVNEAAFVSNPVEKSSSPLFPPEADSRSNGLFAFASSNPVIVIDVFPDRLTSDIKDIVMVFAAPITGDDCVIIFLVKDVKVV